MTPGSPVIPPTVTAERTREAAANHRRKALEMLEDLGHPQAHEVRVAVERTEI